MASKIQVRTSPSAFYDFYIDDKKVCFHDKEMLVEEVVGVTWYIHQSNLKGTCANRYCFYHIKIMDNGGDLIDISFSNQYYRIPTHDIYESLVENIRKHIGAYLFNKIYLNLLQGISTNLKRCSIVPRGLSFFISPLLGRARKCIVPWQDLAYIYDEDATSKRIKFYSPKNSEMHINLFLDEDINAVVLMHFSDWLKRPWERIKEIYRKNNISF